MVGITLGAVSVRAAPPAEPGDGSYGDGSYRGEEALGGDLDEAPLAPPLVDESEGLWLSVEFIGPRGAQLEAAKQLATAPVETALPRGGRPPPGELVGRVHTLDDALRWVDRHAFGAPLSPTTDDPESEAAEIPGGPLVDDYGLFLTALVVTRTHSEGAPWDDLELSAALGPGGDLGWERADLSTARAPMFAAPSPTLPPAAERYLVVERGDDLWVVGERERCVDRDCAPWVRVITREGDRFHAGWLPAHALVLRSQWIRDPSGGPQFALRPAHREAGHAGFVLIERYEHGDGLPRHRRTGLHGPHLGRGWPAANVTLLDHTLSVRIGGELVLTRELAEPTPLLLALPPTRP